MKLNVDVISISMCCPTLICYYLVDKNYGLRDGCRVANKIPVLPHCGLWTVDGTSMNKEYTAVDAVGSLPPL